MNEAIDTDHYRERLQEREQALREDIHRELVKRDNEQYQALAGRVHDRAEQSVAYLLVDLDLAEITRDVEELRDVEAALVRIEQGTYGECIDCGEPINPERLEVLPQAARCHRCQSRLEDRQARDITPSL